MSAPFQTVQANSAQQQLKQKSALVWTTDTGRLLIEDAVSKTQWPVSQYENHERTFTEVAGDGAASTYVATVIVPAGYTVLDVLVGNSAYWDATTTATITVGDADSASGYINAKNLKSGGDFPIQNTGGISARASGLGGTYALGKYYAAAGLITITVTVNDGGTHSAGRTRVAVVMNRGARTVRAAVHTA